MQKIGEYWVPDVDTRWFRNRRKTRANYEGGGHGSQIHHLTGAIAHIRAAAGAQALARSAAVDAGANVGAYARRMAADFAQVHAFEPAADTHACLVRNLADWGLAGKVVAHRAAVSDRADFVAIRSGGWFRRSISREVRGKGNVPALAIDSLGLETVLLLKLDVEGHELKALAGAEATLERCRPYVLMELKARKIEKGTADLGARDFLLARGWREVAGYGAPVIDRLYAPPGRD